MGLRIGIFTGVTDESAGPVRIAQAVEERGFESLFVAEHTHIPARRETPFPGGGDIPRDYYRNFDPLVTLAAAAAVTTTLRLGTAVVLATQRDPIVLAKQLASIDVISDGRLEIGIGAGWLREELRNHGTNPATRVALLSDRLAAMQAIWTQSPAAHHGPFVDFDPIFVWPKPVQTPHPPLWLGGWGPTTHHRAVESGAGWLAPPGLSADVLRRGITELATVAAHLGRPVPPVMVIVFSPTAALLDELADLGISRVLIGLVPVRPWDETLEHLDHAAAVAAAHLSPAGSATA